jgi:glycosyltransferase involved in cell wall biosynthesis
MNKDIEVSVVIPCLNEELTIGKCVRQAVVTLKKLHYRGEVIVVDNNSQDRSGEIARKNGALVYSEKRRGYGSAYIRGLNEARGKYLIIADGDGTYNFSDMGRFIKLIENGYDYVNGSRLKGKILKNAMPWHHQYIGVPFLTWLLNFLFKTHVSDAHCGMRALTKAAFKKMDLRTLGMEFASEMIIKAGDLNLKIAEVPITYYPRLGKSKLNSFRDGWRHIRFMLFYSPTWLFLLPGILCFTFGAVIMGLLLLGPIKISHLSFDVHTMQLAGVLCVLGYELINVWLYAKIFSLTEKFITKDVFLTKFLSYFSLEKMIMAGLLLTIFGSLIYFFVFLKWAAGGFGGLNEMRLAIISTTIIIIGIQTIFSSFFISLLLLSRKRG